MRKIVATRDIFDLCPDFYRGLVIVEEIDNHTVSGAILKLLNQAVADNTGIDMAQDPRLKAWEEVHRKFGSNPNKFPPSIKALLKRIKSNPKLPYINSAVALFNYISLKFGLPCGGDDVDHIQGDLTLGLADGTENFLALGSDLSEAPLAGEVIYYDSLAKTVMCRRWNWRNGAQTKIDVTSRRMVINIDCLPPVGRQAGLQARDELADLLIRHCGARLSVGGLHAGAREVEIGI
jgi:DNA/RNA-binding domain of Phe-tRNA-synthetase-like protein